IISLSKAKQSKAKQSKAKRELYTLINNFLKTFLIILLSFILLFFISCSNKDKTGGSDNGGIGIGSDNGNTNGGTSGGSSSGSGGSSSGDSGSGGSGSGGSESGGSGEPDAGGGSSGDSGGESPAVIGGTTSGEKTGSGVKADLEGYWYCSISPSFGITNGKLSMSNLWFYYEGQIPNSFDYPFSILATETIDGETNTAVFTFYNSTNGAYYYSYSSSGFNIGDSEKKNSSSAGGGSSEGSGSAGGGVIYGKTGSGVKSDLEGSWQAGGYDKFTITDGKLSMTNSSSSSNYHGYEGQIPATFDYPLNIVLTGIVNGETKTAIFTFYNSTKGFCYYDSSIYSKNKVTAEKN
ncbi:hypothetical protein, partial [Brachyspira catarrhinii]|uniref:hypothetical protein n=1 Tax=Brachyspira catarrhinii TaxID=2528966 RepID=UPI00191E8B93